MDPYILFIMAVVVLIVVVAFWRSLDRPRHGPRFARLGSLLTPAEARFFRVLLRAVPVSMAVYVKVRLMDVVTVPDNCWQQYGWKGSGMRLDFVVVARETLAVLLVVELDDRSHFLQRAQERDAYKDAALCSAGVPILRVKAAGVYDVTDLRDKIAEKVIG